MQETAADYCNLLSALDSLSGSDNCNTLLTSSSDSIGKLKERLSSYVVHGCQLDIPRFKEYWVPVELSNVQVEQYCAAMISNCTLLRSSSKTDIVGALHDMLISARKVRLVEWLLETC